MSNKTSKLSATIYDKDKAKYNEAKGEQSHHEFINNVLSIEAQLAKLKKDLGCSSTEAIAHLLDVRNKVVEEGKGYHFANVFVAQAVRGKTEIKAQKITANAIKKYRGVNAKIGKRVIRENAAAVAEFNGQTVEEVLENNKE